MDFKAEKKEGRALILADAVAVYPDGEQAGLILWGSDGQITSLEVYDLNPEASNRFPKTSDLRSWEQWGGANRESGCPERA
jgi:hypothetical protein